MIRRTIVIAATTAATAIALAIAAPLSAAAHVHIDPDRASPGDYTVLTFRVPTESATAGTVKVEVDFPTDTPFTSVSYLPIPGWSAKVTTSTLPKAVKISGATVTKAPTKIVWTADPGVRIEPGQFQQFSVSAGVVPDTGRMVMPAIQTYSDGSVVRWDQPTPASGDEPEHPAPTLYVDDAPPAAHATPVLTSTPVPAATPNSTDAAAIGIGIGGLTLAAIALVVAVLALTRRPRGGARIADDAGHAQSPDRDGGTE